LTIGKKVQEALGMLKTTSGNFQTFALETQDQAAKQMYTNFSKQLDQMITELSGRVQYIESQEPQYKMENMAGAQTDMQQEKSQEMRLK